MDVDDTIKEIGASSSPLPRLDASSCFRPRQPATRSQSSQDKSLSSNLSPPSPCSGIRTGPMSIRESRDIVIPLGRPAALPGRAERRDHAPPSPPADEEEAGVEEEEEEGGGGEEEDDDEEAEELTTEENHQPQPPNPKIYIPKIPPLSSPSPPPPPNLAQLADGLKGMFVDEFGHVLDWEGRVLGRVEGDLPAMVGRPVSDTGEVFSPDGRVVVGHVVENELLAGRQDQERGRGSPQAPGPRPLDSVAGAGLKVDHLGNILDGSGAVVGRLNAASGVAAGRDAAPPPARQASAPSPSEIYLDVKSTNDGIQIVMKIPTMFKGGPPSVTISRDERG